MRSIGRTDAGYPSSRILCVLPHAAREPYDMVGQLVDANLYSAFFSRSNNSGERNLCIALLIEMITSDREATPTKTICYRPSTLPANHTNLSSDST